MKKSAPKIELKAYDDLFETDESRAENKLSKIRDIPLALIDDFPDHPFQVRDDDEDMTQLVESIQKRGIITPATVRLKVDGRYELISGHRRKRACERAGFTTIKADVKELTQDQAVILMVDSNLQRTTILPSERAFSYKMRLEAMKRQAGRPSNENLVPVGLNFSREELSQQTGESQTQIQRYIRLTMLIPEILQMVDDKKIAFRPAVELSYLQEVEQYMLLDRIEREDCTPSLSQAIKMKEFSKENQLSASVILSIMREEKPNQRIKPLFETRITRLIPKSVPKGKESDFIVKAMEFYNRYLQRNKQQDR